MIFVFFPCSKENEKRQETFIKYFNKIELVFQTIHKNWIFNRKLTSSAWKEGLKFLTELEQTPKKTIRAFQNKATELSTKSMNLNEFLPIKFTNFQMRRRI